jgi:hypothetical protein
VPGPALDGNRLNTRMLHPNCPSRPGANADFVRAYVPEGLDFDFMTAKWQDRARWLVGRVYLEHHLRSEAHRDDFVPLWSQALKEVMSARYYRPIINAAVGARVLEEDSSYWATGGGRAGYSKSFRVGPLWRYRPFRSVWLTDPTVVRKVRARKERDERAVTAPVHQHLLTNLRRLELADGFPTVSLPLATIAHQEWRFTVCQQGRAHTNLTSLRTDLRQYLRVGGRTLWQLDIRNSQPFFMALALRDAARLERDEDFLHYKAHLQNINHTLHPSSSHQSPSSPYVVTGDCLNNAHQRDITEYLDLCRTGLLYERLMDEVGLPRTQENRDYVKRKFFAVCYGDVRDGNTRVGRAFQTAFPACWTAVCRLKAGERGGLARWMQTVESWTVLWRVGRRIMERYPNAPLLTVHDSVVTTEGYVEPFRALLEAGFNETFGVCPQFKTGPFGEK